MGHVHNLIGSIHTHQPEVDIAVYNLGFSDETTKDLENVCDSDYSLLLFSSSFYFISISFFFSFLFIVIKLNELQYCGVTVHKFNFDAYPSHVQALKNFAWKALVVKQALLDYGKVQREERGRGRKGD